MTATMLDEADGNLEHAFEYFQRQRRGLGVEFAEEFRRALDLMLKHPNASQALDETYRRCRLHTLPG